MAVGAAPDASATPNAARWYSHVAALLAKAFPGTPAGVTGASAPAAAGKKEQPKKEQPKKEKKEKKAPPPKKEKKEPTAEEKRAKQVKDAKKEGGKKAVDIAGAAEMTLGMEVRTERARAPGAQARSPRPRTALGAPLARR